MFFVIIIIIICTLKPRHHTHFVSPAHNTKSRLHPCVVTTVPATVTEQISCSSSYQRCI